MDIDSFDNESSTVLDALCDDLNTSKAIAEIIEIAKNLSKADSDDLKKKFKKSSYFQLIFWEFFKNLQMYGLELVKLMII